MAEVSGQSGSLDQTVKGMLAPAVSAAKEAGSKRYHTQAGIQRELLALVADGREPDTVALRGQIRRLLVLMLSEATGTLDIRELVKMLMDLEGYKRPSIASGDDGPGDERVAALAKKAANG